MSYLKSYPDSQRKWQQSSRNRAVERQKEVRQGSMQGKQEKTSVGRLRGKLRSGSGTLKAGVPLKRKSRTTIKDAQWSRAVKERDNFTCQWPGCGKFDKHNDPHHIALRSARPDLRWIVSNGVTLCRFHHDHVHRAGRQEALRTGFLNLETYEAAAKEMAAA